jgi:hypothetical protein
LEELMSNTDLTSRSNTTTIWVKFTKPGIHCYPNAPDEVSYLRSPHRHLFYFKVSISVFHDDREIEFHMFLNRLKALYETSILQLDHKSCEMIATELLEQILKMYDCRLRQVVVEVSEDDECGAVVCSTPT